MNTLIQRLAVIAVLTAAAAANAQYARPGSAPAPVAQRAAPAPVIRAQPVAPAPTQARPAVPAVPAPALVTAGPCFEVMNPSDTTLMTVLRSYSLLCATVTKTGFPTRLRATAAGELISEKGAPTVLYRE